MNVSFILPQSFEVKTLELMLNQILKTHGGWGAPGLVAFGIAEYHAILQCVILGVAHNCNQCYMFKMCLKTNFQNAAIMF